MPGTISPTPLEILYKISRELVASLDLHMVLARVLVLSTENMGAERASLVVLDPAGNPADAAIIFDGELIPSTLKQMEDILKSGLAGWVLRHRETVVLVNTHKDKRWLQKPGKNREIDVPKSALCVPILAQEHLLGILTIVHPQLDYFSSEQVKLQQAIADIAGIAIHNAQLHADVHTVSKRYQDLFENSIDPILITDLSGEILETNQKALYVSGYSVEEIKKIQINALHEPSNEVLSRIIYTPGSTEVVKYTSRMYCNAGRKIPVEIQVSHINLQEKDHVQWIFRDISEKLQSDKLREDLTSMVYHDLRSPLANVISSIELLEESLPVEQQPQVKQLFEIAHRSTARLQRLISSLLDIDRLEAGQGIILRRPVEVEPLIKEAVETVLPTAHNKEISIDELIPAAIPPLNIDEDMVRRVIINLLENACKFSPQHTRVTIGAKLNGEVITIWVDDQGPGIPVESREKVFEKFVRLQGDNPVKGFGLGLAFCRIAIQAHGGKIWVENLAEGGSRFMFTLAAVMQNNKKN